MKLLFISIRDVSLKNSGGEKCTNRNYLSFCELLGQENVEVVDISRFVERNIIKAFLKRFSVFFGFYAGLSRKITNQIIKKSAGTDYVFIDASYLGVISYYLKRAGYKGKILCFFHNVEVNVMKQKTRIRPADFWKTFLIQYNERKAIRFSDRVIALNRRDSEELVRIYQAKDIDIIPISLPDELIHSSPDLTRIPPTFLFVGDNWYANIHGLKWFVNNVLDHVNIKLQIAGRNMEPYREEFSHPKIEFLGYVTDISWLITNADYILSPIFIGGGMKVKICEALMYGKNIIATREAFEGYELDYHETGVICNTRQEFIEAIDKYCSVERPKFNLKSREYYLEKYSFRATLQKFNQLIS
jgi:polysaccharide biosynthesis protein PslH